MAADELKKLHTALVDTRGAYEKAAKDAVDAKRSSCLQRYGDAAP